METVVYTNVSGLANNMKRLAQLEKEFNRNYTVLVFTIALVLAILNLVL